MRAFKDARLSVTTTGTPPIVLSLMKNSTVLGRAVSAGKFKLSGQGNYSCVAVNNYGNYTRIDFSVVFIGKYCLVCDVVSFFYRIPLNHRTYIQSHPHRGTRGRGGGLIESPWVFDMLQFCLRLKAFDLLYKKRYILWMVALLKVCDVTKYGRHLDRRLGFYQELEIG